MCPLPKKSSLKSMILHALLFSALLALDIMTKKMVVAKIDLGRSIQIIKNVVSFSYVRNTGAAFGIFAGNRLVLTVLSIIILGSLIGAMVYMKPKDETVKFAVCMIAAGAVGNLIDRIRLGYVVDFIEVKFFSFPVFNLADCFVCIGAFLLVVYIMLQKEE